MSSAQHRESLFHRSIFETAVDAIIIINGGGIIQTVNTATNRLFGYPTEALIGQNVSILVPPDHKRHHDGYIRRFLNTGERHIIGIGREVLAARQDHSTFPAFLSISHFQIDGADFFTGVIRDISELKQKEADLEAANAQLNVQSFITSRMLELSRKTQGEQHEQRLCQVIIETLCDHVDAFSGAIYVLRKAEGGGAMSHAQLQPIAGISLPQPVAMLPTLELGQGLAGQAARDRQRRQIEPPPGRWRLPTSLGSVEPQALVAVPLMHGDALIAVAELALLHPLADLQAAYLDAVSESAAITLTLARDQRRITELLHNTQSQSDHLQAAHDEIQEKARALELSGRYKSTFVANISHELRTPLNSILLLARLLSENRQGNLTPDQTASARTIATSGNNLLALINDILDLTKVEAGQMRFDFQEAELGYVLDDLERSFRPLMEQKGLAFYIERREPTPGQITTDALRLGQILRNLLSNACKFTEAGHVTLSVSADDTHLFFAVEDTGVGIAAEVQPKIFDAFYQADDRSNRRYEGTGLGLSISKDLAQHLGGDLTLISALGEGSTFTLSLPLSPPAAQAPATLIAQDPSAAPAKKPKPSRASGEPGWLHGVGIVAMDKSMRDVFALRQHLLRQGAQLTVAASEEEIPALLEMSPDVQALILGLSGEAGEVLGLIRRLRAHSHWRALPILIAGSSDDSHDLEACIAAGANGTISKPIDGEQLLEQIKICLELA